MTTYVIKIGGHALIDLSTESAALATFAQDIVALTSEGAHVVVIHGGGPTIASLLELVGEPSTFVDGLRVTTPSVMQYVDMALAHVNRELVSRLRQHGVPAVGVSGVDGATLTAQAVGGPLQRVATQPRVDVTLIKHLWSGGFIPVVSPVANDDTWQRVNCNADTAAGAIAGALNADALLLLSDIDQVRTDVADSSSGLRSVTVAEIAALMASGAAQGGMRPKLQAAVDAIEAGAQRVWLANGTREHCVRDLLAHQLPTTEILP
jgi:acetylglutamate kinase